MKYCHRQREHSQYCRYESTQWLTNECTSGVVITEGVASVTETSLSAVLNAASSVVRVTDSVGAIGSGWKRTYQRN